MDTGFELNNKQEYQGMKLGLALREGTSIIWHTAAAGASIRALICSLEGLSRSSKQEFSMRDIKERALNVLGRLFIARLRNVDLKHVYIDVFQTLYFRKTLYFRCTSVNIFVFQVFLCLICTQLRKSKCGSNVTSACIQRVNTRKVMITLYCLSFFFQGTPLM